MKKEIILLMLTMMLVGCASEPVKTNQVSSVEVEEAGTSEQIEKVEKEIEVPELTESDKEILDSTISDWTFGVYDDCEFKYEYASKDDGSVELVIFAKISQDYVANLYGLKEYDSNTIQDRIFTDLTFENVYITLNEMEDSIMSQDISSMTMIYNDLDGSFYGASCFPKPY